MDRAGLNQAKWMWIMKHIQLETSGKKNSAGKRPGPHNTCKVGGEELEEEELIP
eukprot:gene3488-872_t